MSTNYEHNGEDDLRAARLTAHALGQTEGDDRAAVEREMTASPQARQEVESAAAIVARLKDAAQAAPSVQPSAALHAAVEKRLDELESTAQSSPLPRVVPSRRRRRLIALALTAACLAAIAVPLVKWTNYFGQGEPRQFAKNATAPRLDAEKKALDDAAKLLVRGSPSKVANQNAPEQSPERARFSIVPATPAPSDADWAHRKWLSEPMSSHEIHSFPAAPAPQLDLDAILKNTTFSSGVGQAYSGLNISVNGLLPIEIDPQETQTGRLMFGVGLNSDAGLIRNVTLDGKNASLPPLSLDSGDQHRGVSNRNIAVSGIGWKDGSALEPQQGGGPSNLGQGYSGPTNSSYNDNGTVPYAVGAGTVTHSSNGGNERFAIGANAPLAGPGGASVSGNLIASAPALGHATSGGTIGIDPVQVQLLEGLDVIVLRGNPQDVAAVNEIITKLEVESKRQEPDANRPSSGAPARDKEIQPVDIESLSNLETFHQSASPEDIAEVKRIIEQIEQSRRQEPNAARSSRGVPNDLAEKLRIVLARLEANGKKPDKSASKKPPETWKPARVVPNASRLMVGEKEVLPLKGMQVDVRVDGFRARVLLDLYYFNDRPQQLEGNFQLRLPDEAAPYFFAFGKTVYQAPQVTASDSMFFKPQQVSLGDTTPEKIMALRGNSWEQPKVARMVPKEKAAMAYRDTVRRRIDPALVEWSGAGVFQCRVFPLAPQSLHRVTIGYDVDLVRVGDDLELRLDLPEPPAPATVVDLNVAAADARQVSLGPLSLRERVRVRADGSATPAGDASALTRDEKSNGQGAQPTLTPSPSPGGRGEPGRLAYRLVDPKNRPLTVRLRKPGTQMLTGNDDATGNYFATRVMLPLPETTAVERPNKAIFLVDTSLSAGPQFPLWTKLLRATLENNRDPQAGTPIKQFAVLFFNVETFWWQEKYVANTPENVDAMINYADSLALEGATDLGRALQEAAAPRWGRGEASTSPDLFLLSDGAATWGEDRWALLAASVCSTGFSRNADTMPPKGGTTSAEPPKGGTPALFAYRTGLAGGDSRLLAYLAERTGGAVFSLVGEAEIAAASMAHRNRPWQLTNIEMAGAHDLLIAGRPQYVFPGQQLTVVGRLEANRSDQSNRSDQPVLVFTLKQGKATQTIKVAMDQVLSSELAGRTYGQVATNQLEDVCGALTPGYPLGASPGGRGEVEPVATAYARHFRITGRTCSLLMLESEQDYARFNIKPEDDSFVVKQRPADAIVSKAIDEVVAAMSDPKATFLAWYNRLGAAEVRFDLPGSLKVFIDGLPEETFAVAPSPLACKLRLRQDLPDNLRQPWQTGLPDYETLDAEAQRRLSAYGPDDALRCLSSLVEERPGDAALARDLAFTAIDWQRPGEAYHLLRRASAGRTFEPITFHAMAHCLEQMGRADLAIIYYELACGGQWDARFGDMHNIALLDYARFLRRVVQSDGTSKGDSPVFAGARTGTVPYAQSRLNTLTAMNLRDTADVATLIFWNTDGTDVDLHVVEPSGEECFYSHTQTASGGHISRDVTTGYGPELYLLPKAPSGRYEINAHYFATDMNRASTRTKVLAFIYENWGEKDERVTIKSLALTGRSEKHELGVVKR